MENNIIKNGTCAQQDTIMELGKPWAEAWPDEPAAETATAVVEADAAEEGDFLEADRWREADPAPYWLDFTAPYEAPSYVLSYKGVKFAPLGGIHAITGQAGHGKSNALAMLIAAVLAGEYGELRYELSNKVRVPRVLYVDTEQELANTIALKNRVQVMSGRSINDNRDDFRVLALREVQAADGLSAADRRFRLIMKAIDEFRPMVVIIDGLLDIIENFNSIDDCQALINKLMGIASHYDSSLWCLLHQNPGGEKLVGHLGSMLERKATDIFVAVKDKESDFTSAPVFTIRQKKARGADVPDCLFRFETVDGWGRPVQITETAVQGRNRTGHVQKPGISPENVKRLLTDGQLAIQWPATGQEIKNLIFRTLGGIKSSDSQQECIMIARNRRFIIEQPESERENGQRMSKFYLNPEEINNTNTNGDGRV